MLDDNGCLTDNKRDEEKSLLALQRRRQYVKNLQQQLSLNKLILPDYEMKLDNSKLYTSNKPSRVTEKDLNNKCYTRWSDQVWRFKFKHSEGLKI